MLKKRGQLTLFIIIGILVVISVLVAIFFISPEIYGIKPANTRADSFESCAKEVIDNSVEELSKTAGFTGNYFNVTYNSVDIPYVCYTDEYYKPCIVQVPFLENKFKESLASRIEDGVSHCYNDYVDEFQGQGYEVTTGEIEVESDLQMEKIELVISAPLTISDDSSTSSLRDIEVEIPTKIYDVIMLANNIVKFETVYGEYDLVQSQLLYPDIPVIRTKIDDGTAIYTILDQETKYKFAVRSYVNPPGYGF